MYFSLHHRFVELPYGYLSHLEDRTTGKRLHPLMITFARLGLSVAHGLAIITFACCSPLAYAQSSVVGQWSSVMTTPYEAVHMVLLPTGKVMMWSHFAESLHPQLWDPATGNFAAAAQPSYQIFCAGHSLLPNGSVLVTGGNVVLGVGYAHASVYDPLADAWSALPDMNAARWYPNNVTLGTGDVVVMSGTIDQTNGDNTMPQVWQVASQTWRNLSSAELALSAYEHAHLAPNGMVFTTGPPKVSRYLNTSGSGAWSWVANSNYGTRDYGVSVIYDSGKILLVGGGDPPTNTAEVIDLTAASPLWSYTGSMANVRRQHNATALPDGTVLITGGSSGGTFDNSSNPVYAAELWNPSTGQFTTLASNTVYRGYHSTALLLPDGRVLSAGGDTAGASAEIFSPPYLFNGPQPTITSAPSSVHYGQAFYISTPDAANITQVTWLALGATTHGFDQNQRFNRLSFSQASGRLTVTAPSNPNLAPPGYYMLFLVNSSGVPSVAAMVSISGSVGLLQTGLNFNTQVLGTSSGTQTTTLANNQPAPMKISSITVSGDFAQSNNCVSPLSPNATCLINVTFAPTAVGSRTGTLTVTDDAANSPQTASLTGTGLLPVALSGSSFGFGAQVVSTTSAAKTVILKNNQSVPLNISSIAASGDFAQTNNCLSPLASNASCTISMTFKPTALGARIGAVTVTDDANTSPQSANLNGSGIVAVALSATSLSFGNQVISQTSAAKTVTLKNNQNVALNLSSIVASGDFAQTNSCASPLAAGAACTITVTFTPSAIGLRSGAITVTDDAVSSPQSVSLNGTGLVPVALSGSAFGFGQQVIGTTSAAKVTLKNNQSVPLNLSSITASGDFAQTNNCVSPLAAGTSCTINVTFTPTVLGNRAGSLTITDDAITSPQSASLAGAGVVAVGLSAGSLSFGNQAVSTTSAPQTVTLKNNQSVPLNISSIATSGDFAQTNNCVSPVGSGVSCTITVTFTPTATGTRTGTLTVSDDAISSPQTVNLSGAGQ